jgi:FixJ family two-component response regulator
LLPKGYGKSKRETPFFSPSLAKQHREHYQKSPGRVGLVKKKGDRLTSREVEVLQLIAEGKANEEAAAELGITTKTGVLRLAPTCSDLSRSRQVSLTALTACRRGPRFPKSAYGVNTP